MAASSDKQDSAVMEFAVNMTCEGCVKSVKNSLQGVDGVKSVDVNLGTDQVIIESTLTSKQIQSLIEKTGKTAVLQGYGSLNQTPLESGVVELNTGDNKIQGVIRLVQSNPSKCIIDGTIDGLPKGRHRLFIHELGDVSQGCDSCGDILGRLSPETEKPMGDIGEIDVAANGRADFRLTNERLKVWDMIGRSIVVHQGSQEGLIPKIQKKLSCGIIARSAGLFQNSEKKICTCDGVTIWEERYVPAAGVGRKSKI
ncbi:copper chaperone for superoxide dismutase-like isoform X2 [Ostrea edulis]|uniref:copper chaperone for superoxide dismutase-like isoform X2 n=1 Tax=Ostrea edulis TaxID=37623 RepID=UPI0024AF83D7|nr:copper chaperone for superoxide dismutase-like isoform X2 [Ostrea edulis]